VRHHKVQIFSLGAPKEGTPKDRRRYRVKWLVDGRHKTRSFKTKAEAEALRARLLVEAQTSGSGRPGSVEFMVV
jgi:hypothetical protein